MGAGHFGHLFLAQTGIFVSKAFIMFTTPVVRIYLDHASDLRADSSCGMCMAYSVFVANNGSLDDRLLVHTRIF